MSVINVPESGDVAEAFLTPRKRTVLKRALFNFFTSVKKNPSRYKDKFGIQCDKTVRGHIRYIEELFDDFNIDKKCLEE